MWCEVCPQFNDDGLCGQSLPSANCRTAHRRGTLCCIVRLIARSSGGAVRSLLVYKHCRMICAHMCSVHHSCFLDFLPHTPRHISFRKASTIPRQDHRGYKTDLCTAEWRAQRGNQGARVIQGAHPQYAPLLFCTATLRPCITAGFGAVFPM